MIKFISGVIVGIMISTVGVSGVVHLLDKSVDTVKSETKEFLK